MYWLWSNSEPSHSGVVTMSVSLLEVIEHGGYKLDTVEDATWLLSKQSEFNELIEKAQEVVDGE